MAARREALGHRVQADFARNFRILKRQLSQLNATIAEWEEDWTRADSPPRHKHVRRPARRYGRAW